jgi:Uma2 family endonuclease
MSKLTIYDSEEDKFSVVEEPDPSIQYTYADYLEWKFEESLELFRGRIYKLAAPGTKHQAVSRNLLVTTTQQLKGRACQVFAAPFDVRLPVKNRRKDTEINTVVQPDLCVICDPTKIDERGCCGAPDLVVEILSPGNSRKEIKLKHELYEEAGVKEYFIINPAEENLVVFLLTEQGKLEGLKMYATGDTLHSNAIPGLAIHLTEIFNN